MKTLLTSRAGVIVACLFAFMMAVVVQRILARRSERKIPVALQAESAKAGESRLTVPAPAPPAAVRPQNVATKTPGEISSKVGAADSRAQQDLAYLDQYQKTSSKSRVDRDRQGRTITRRRTASPVAADRNGSSRRDEAQASGSQLRLRGKVLGEKEGAAKARPVSDGVPASRPAGATDRIVQDDAVPVGFVPYGRPLKCELVFTIDSTLDESPVVALVVEPVYNNGTLVIPAGAELHGLARPDRLRDRLFSAQDWMLVMPRGEGRINGRELRVKGVALDRAEPTGDGLTWGITDGSLGLQGTVIRTMEFDELKRFAATFVSAAALGLQEREGVRGTSRVASTPRNAALQGLAVSLEEVARKIAEEVGRNGVFIRVPGGKQFYFYPQQAIVPEAATEPSAPRRQAATTPGSLKTP